MLIKPYLLDDKTGLFFVIFVLIAITYPNSFKHSCIIKFVIVRLRIYHSSDKTDIKIMHSYRSFHQNNINHLIMSICSHSVVVIWQFSKSNASKKRTALKCTFYLYTFFETNSGYR